MILTSQNIWIIGIAQEPYSHDYYLVFYQDLRSVLDRLIQMMKNSHGRSLEFIQYEHFDELEEIGSGGYGKVYMAKYKSNERVVLKRFKKLDEKPELFVSEVSTSHVVLSINC